MREWVAVNLANPHMIEVHFDLRHQRRDQLPNLSRLGILEGFTHISQHPGRFLDLFVIRGVGVCLCLPSGV